MIWAVLAGDKALFKQTTLSMLSHALRRTQEHAAKEIQTRLKHGSRPVSDAQHLLKGAQAAPEAVVGVDQAPPVLAVLAGAGCIPGKASHKVGYAQAGRPAHPSSTVHQHTCIPHQVLMTVRSNKGL